MPSPQLTQDILDQRARLITQEAALGSEVDRLTSQLGAEWGREIRKTLRTQGPLTETQLASLERRAAMASRLGTITDKTLKQVEGLLGRQVQDTLKTEYYRYSAMLHGQAVGTSVGMEAGFNRLQPGVIKAALAGPIAGASATQTFKAMSAKAETRMRQDLARAVANGYNVDKLEAEWRAGRGAAKARREAKIVTITAMHAAANNAAIESFRQSNIQEVRWEATFDSRTCPVCGSRHGRTYRLDMAPANPAHFQCRCTWLPVLSGDVAQEFDDLQAYQMPSGDVAFRKADRSFESWLRKAPEDISRDFWGSQLKHDTWGKDKIPVEAFVKPNGRVLTDVEVKAKLANGTLWQGARWSDKPIHVPQSMGSTPTTLGARVVPQPIKLTLGERLDEFEGAKGAMLEKTRAYLDSLPAWADELTTLANVKPVYASTVIEQAPELKGRTPRGWTSGSTWGRADGIFKEKTQEVVQAESVYLRGVKVPTKRLVMPHEFGHAIDYSFGAVGRAPDQVRIAGADLAPRASTSKGFVEAYKADLAHAANLDGGDAKHKAIYSYLRQRGPAGLSECFAEAWGVMTSGTSIVYGAAGIVTEAEFAGAWPNVTAYMRGVIQTGQLP